jgi:hypothetical protein
MPIMPVDLIYLYFCSLYAPWGGVRLQKCAKYDKSPLLLCDKATTRIFPQLHIYYPDRQFADPMGQKIFTNSQPLGQKVFFMDLSSF